MNRKLMKSLSFSIQKLYCFGAFFLIPMVFFGQNIIVKGTITEASTISPLPGVNIIVKGTNNGVTTDFDGNYEIATQKGDVLVYSFIGYVTIEKTVANSIINVSMQENAESLNEIVLIGYGSTRKKDLTGSITQIDSKEFQKGFVTNAEQLIANKVPGVQITPISGKPGAGSSFLLRGGASLSASNTPLFVIDGVPIGLSDGPGVLSALNPDDIASFTVLKDASAAAIYGSRGSNGVIIITTKKGKTGDLKISFTSKLSVSTNVFNQDVITGDQYRAIAEKASLVSGVPIADFNLGTANTNWQDEIFKNALTTDHSISLSGGIKNLPYRLSLGHLDQDGTLKTGNFKRNTVTINLSPTFFDNHLKINLNVKGISQDERKADESSIYTAVNFDPTQSVRDENSIYGGYWQYEEFASNPAVLHGHNNPVSKLDQVNDKVKNMRSIGNIQIDYKLHFFPDLSVKINTGYDIAKSKWNYFVPANHFPANISNGVVSKGDPGSETKNVFSEITLNYLKDIESIKSRINILAGYGYNDFKTTNYFYPTYDVDGAIQTGSSPNFDFDIPQNTLISYFGRLIYTLNDKYVLTGTIRTDGSSRFSKNNRWGVFPSASLAWKISDENFLKESKTISDLKFRIGYGITGQQNGIGNYGYIPTYNLGSSSISYPIGNDFVQGVNPSATDRNRKWEQSITSNAGLDWGLFNNRLSGSFDVYYRETEDLLNQITIPSGTDFANSIVKNIGSLENKGFEIKVNATPIQKTDFSWNLGFNYSYNENKITKLSEGDDSGTGLFSSNILVNTVGYTRNTFFLYHQVYDTNGNPIEDQMVDINNDGAINEKDRYRTKSSTPKHIMGFNTTFNYKKLALSMAFHSNLGQYVFFKPSDNLSSVYNGIFRSNIHQSYFDTNFTQSGNNNQNFSDYYLQNASFLKMDNINLSYDLGNLLKGKKNPINLIVSASVQNVFTITGFTGGDPEAAWNYGNSSGGSYTAPRTFSTSLKFNF
ncbi:SusC/RagA family TonB-linked outer membrane protein [Thalassobellus citreus]|uniref:SusC/RagA family TonB-linked outer membrane protein n=1 Tax=Thalassobellus citreus TaxID=3367752 RepID=UPI0037A899F3